MKLTRDQMKQIAISVMKKVGIYPPFVKQFQEKDQVTMFISGLGYTIDEQTEDNLLEIIQTIEADGDKLVYAVSKNLLGDDTVYSLLLVTAEDNENSAANEYTIEGVRVFEILAYCYNASCDFCSEYGYITVQNRYGGVRRIG